MCQIKHTRPYSFAIALHSMLDGEAVFIAPFPLLFAVLNYYVAVVTGNYWNAGTSADVFMTVYGERGDTGQGCCIKQRGARGLVKERSVDRFLLTKPLSPCLCDSTSTFLRLFVELQGGDSNLHHKSNGFDGAGLFCAVNTVSLRLK